MATQFKTGRSRTLTWKGGGTVPNRVHDQPVTPGSYVNYSQVGSVQIIFPFGPDAFHLGQFEVLTGGGKYENYLVQYWDGWDTPQTVDTRFTPTPGPGPTYDWDTPATFTYQCSIELEEWFVTDGLASYDPTQVTTIDGTDFPNYGGAAQGDALPANYCYFEERGKIGGVATVSVTVNGAAYTQSHTLVAGDDHAMPNGYLMEAIIQASAFNGECTITVSETKAGGVISPSYSESWASDGDTGYVFADGSTFTASITCPPGILDALTVLDAACQAPDYYGVDLRARSWADPCPSAVTLYLQDKRRLSGGTFDISYVPVILNPEYVATIEQMTYLCRSSYNVNNAPSNTAMPQALVAERCPVRTWVASTFFAGGDDFKDWRCPILGKPFLSFLMSQDASTSVYGGASGPTSITFSVTDWEGYRYLQFTADQPGSLIFTNPAGDTKTYSWTVTTAGTAETITLDLCSPTAWSVAALPSVDTRPSRFPLVVPASSPVGNVVDEMTPATAAKGAYWGIFKVSSCSVVNSGGSTLNLGPMSLIRKTGSAATFLPKFLPDFYGWRDGASTSYDFAPFVTLESDGKQVADWPGMEHVLPTSGSNSFAYESLSSLLGYIASTPGWHTTPASSFPTDGYHNNGGPALWVYGSGSYYRGGASGAWYDGVDVSMSAGTLQVYAQPLYDQVQGYPGIGDPWESTSYPSTGLSTAMPVRMTKYLRGQAWGLTLRTSDGKPLQGATVKAFGYNLPHANMGSGISDVQGIYKTGAPYGFGGLDIETQLAVSSPPSDHQVWNNRWRKRDSFRGALSGEKMPWNLESDDGELHVALVNASNDLVFRYSSFPVPGGGSVSGPSIWAIDVTITSSGGWAWPRFCRDYRGRLELRAIHTNQGMSDPLASGAYRIYSDDSGATWGPFTGGNLVPESVNMASILSDVRSSPDGVLLEISFVPDTGTSGPGTFSARLKGPGDASFGSPFTPVDDTGSNLRSDGTGFGFDKAREAPDRWCLSMVKDGDTMVSAWYSADDATSWKVFTP